MSSNSPVSSLSAETSAVSSNDDLRDITGDSSHAERGGVSYEYATEMASITLDGLPAEENNVGGEIPQLVHPGSEDQYTLGPEKEGQHCLTFHDITYEVTLRKCCFKQEEKQILKAVSGMMIPGLNAIMGPTGSGKTTLLDTLADRKDRSGLSGKVLINGKKRPHNYKCLVGYVVQDDVVMGTLSVRENLQFSAALRLPSHVTAKQRKERVKKVITELGLMGCADTKVGTEFFRGVSGGERKRTNIGMELIIEPQVLFLDEPTTGLDAHTAVSVVQLLKQLSEVTDRIIIMSIHQPRYAIFKLFDSLTLLSLGDIVYHGPPYHALDYFKSMDFVCEEHDNPADFFLDTLINCAAYSDNIHTAPGVSLTFSVDLVSQYHLSTDYQKLRAKLDPLLKGAITEVKTAGIIERTLQRNRRSVSYARNAIWQFLIVALRSAVNLIRNPATSILQLVTTIVFALVVGGIFFNRGLEPLGFEDRIGVIFFIGINQAFNSLSAVHAFITDRALFIHENASGYYRVSAFFLAKVLTDVIPLRVIPSVAFCIITYFMIGFQLSASKFFIYLLTVWLTTVAAVSIGFFVSASVMVGTVANLLVTITFVISALLGGGLIGFSSLPGWINWAQYLSFLRYSIEAMAINEIGGLTFQGECQITVDSAGTCSAPSSNTAPSNITCCIFEGQDRLAERGFQIGWLWYDILALVVFTIFFLALTYIVLLVIKKEK